MKLKKDMDEDLCVYCPLTEFGYIKLNTSHFNLCFGSRCDEAYENYIEDESEDK